MTFEELLKKHKGTDYDYDHYDGENELTIYKISYYYPEANDSELGKEEQALYDDAIKFLNENNIKFEEEETKKTRSVYNPTDDYDEDYECYCIIIRWED